MLQHNIEVGYSVHSKIYRKPNFKVRDEPFSFSEAIWKTISRRFKLLHGYYWTFLVTYIEIEKQNTERKYLENVQVGNGRRKIIIQKR